MTAFGIKLLIWLAVLTVLVLVASWLGFRSYARFAKRARGPMMVAMPRAGADTALDSFCDPLEAAHPGQTGLMNVLENAEAFTLRTLAARQAGRSLDLMYYAWSTDTTGWLMLAELLAAADRGVRIRLLLDDVNVQGFDPAFLALNQHPNVHVRLFNPTRNRGHAFRRGLEMLLGLSRFTKRMHGKMWLADGRLAIVGGRNIGDMYFGALEGGGRNAQDADVLLIGPPVADLAVVFDGYWNLGLVLPILTLSPRFKVNMKRFRRRLARHVNDGAAQRFQAAVGRADLAALQQRLRWTDKASVLADPPEKAFGKRVTPWMSEGIATLLDGAQHEVRLITPYFVPGIPALQALSRLARRGVRVTLLTNALSATDNVLVHGAYRHYRQPLLAAGANLHEYGPPRRPEGKRDVLHSKVFLVDGRTAVVGSLNFDLRSALMNTELGLQFDQPELVAELEAMIDRLSAPENSYALSLRGKRLLWAVARPGHAPLLRVEPEAPASLRAISWVIGHLPIHGYL
ncbi:phospholipase D family protein [Rhodobacter ferrooxidans]|uniref:Phospholipase D n=1 Tax=Rhodobacter ferrooxidans TaxID=371731 RepID=C8RX32_9RHOB|nr:phospholipase D family protein [Rhodobacter sp. SW2]EEW26557.1 phospholipase D/Transphosphatidylase [Rhodobacter sp. SW2]